MRETKVRGRLRELVLVLQTVSFILLAGVYIVVEKLVTHVKRQWYLYLVIFFLLALLAFKRETRHTAAKAGQSATVVYDALSGAEGNLSPDEPGQSEIGQAAEESISVVVSIDPSSSQCVAACPGSCAGPARFGGSPFQGEGWRFAQDVGLYYLQVKSGWLVSPTTPGRGTDIVYVPRFPRPKFHPKINRGQCRGEGCGAWFEKERLRNRGLRDIGPGTGRRLDLAPGAVPESSLPGAAAPSRVSPKITTTVPADGAENQPESGSDMPALPEDPRKSGGETGSDGGDVLRLPDGGWFGGGKDGDEEDVLPDNIAGLPEIGGACPGRSVLGADADDAGGVGACGR
ncbi:MAG: hypothetical protein LBR82_08935 [Desulfovibrio sp.]|nr:hypothetical protein [Desulfovibrio sp.]